MGTLDLDARRAEYDSEGHKVTLAGETWMLPAKFPLIAAQYLQAGQIDRAVGILFGDDAVEQVTPLLNDDDLNAILGELYDLEPPDEPPKLVSANGAKGNRAARRAK